MRTLFITAMSLALLAGCSSAPESYSAESEPLEDGQADLVRQHAALAIEQCGRGNVQQVSVSGFSCFDR